MFDLKNLLGSYGTVGAFQGTVALHSKQTALLALSTCPRVMQVKKRFCPKPAVVPEESHYLLGSIPKSPLTVINKPE